MDSDDRMVGRILSRREVLGLFGAAGAALVIGCGGDDDDAASPTAAGESPTAGTSPVEAASATATEGAAATAVTEPLPTCVVSPELTEGPYFVDTMLERSDIRTDPASGEASDGTPLALRFRVLEAVSGGCTPLAGAMVDVWHCDALGVYSGVDDPGFDTSGQQFLRGFQVTGNDGNADFTTIFPGWYQGRAVHIHFKARGTREDGQSYEFTSQLFFDDDQADVIYADAPYASKGLPTLRNEGDGIYQESGGITLVPLAETAGGYEGTFAIGLSFA